MRTIYLRKDDINITRKILIDMAYAVSNKKIRLPRYQFEDSLYLIFIPDLKDKSKTEKYFLTKEKIISEDQHNYFFKFPFKADQVTESST